MFLSVEEGVKKQRGRIMEVEAGIVIEILFIVPLIFVSLGVYFSTVIIGGQERITGNGLLGVCASLVPVCIDSRVVVAHACECNSLPKQLRKFRVLTLHCCRYI